MEQIPAGAVRRGVRGQGAVVDAIEQGPSVACPPLAAILHVPEEQYREQHGTDAIDSTTLLQSAHVVLRGGVASSGGATQPKLGGPA